ncbi:hypothetical protein J3E68DRAFT_361873 [Trichoderma sp. SZMC 28012]
MHFIKEAFILGLAAASVSAFRISKRCPSFKGSFNVSVLDLYPESADWDLAHCKFYFGRELLYHVILHVVSQEGTRLLHNASVAVYDPYRQKLDEIISFPVIAGTDGYTISGIDYDRGKSVHVPAKGFPDNIAGSDRLVAPQKYDGKVLLWADDRFNIRVFGSSDGWTSAEYLGLVPIDSNLQLFVCEC